MRSVRCLSLFLKSMLTVVLLLLASKANSQSGTLPVFYINTENAQAIKSKTEYVPATYYIVSDDSSLVVGSEASPLNLEIRGRGHSSWRGNKKPYKIKLAEKHPLLGMKSQKHWALLKFYEPTVAGLELGNILGMDWTATTKPVEVVLNGDYIGLYLLTETNRISNNRLDIYEQANGNEDEETIPYGWLVEVDNYKESNQIMVKENSTWNIRITYHSPDSLSSAQKEWLTNEFQDINAAIYDVDKEHSTWEQYIDVESMARYFIVQEVMDNTDGFHGSFYLHKDSTEDARWVAGPLWDMSCSQRAKTDYTFRMKASYVFTPHWIGELIQDEDFCNAVRQAWADFYSYDVDAWMDYIDEHLYPCFDAYEHEKKRWDYDNQSDLKSRISNLKNALLANIEWFNDHLPYGTTTSVSDLELADSRVVKVEYINMAGLRNSKPWPGINIKETTFADGTTKTTKVIIK